MIDALALSLAMLAGAVLMLAIIAAALYMEVRKQ